jgi:hypothetical protein
MLIGLMVLVMAGVCGAGTSEVWGGYLKYNTAITIPVGPFEDDAGDGVLVAPSLAAGNMNATFIYSTGAIVENADLSAATNLLTLITATTDPDLWYTFLITAANTANLGPLKITFWDDGNNDIEPKTYNFIVLSARAYNLQYGGIVDVETVLTAAPATSGGVADSVWDEARSGHVTTGTYGAMVNSGIVSGTCRVTRTCAADEAQLADTASGDPSITESAYDGYMILIYGGTGIGQQAKIQYYSGHSGTATEDNYVVVSPSWATPLDGTSLYRIVPGTSSTAPPSNTGLSVWSGKIVGGAGTDHVHLSAVKPSPSITDEAYTGYRLVCESGVCAGEVHRIKSYVGSTRVVTIDETFTSGTPSAFDSFSIVPAGYIPQENDDTFVQAIGENNYITSGDIRTVFTPTTTIVQLEDSDSGTPNTTSVYPDYYNGCLIYIYSGTGIGQYRFITDYTGHSSTAAGDNKITVDTSFSPVLDATSSYKIYRNAYTTLAWIEKQIAGTVSINKLSPLGTVIEDVATGTSGTTTIYLSGTVSSLLVTPGAILEWSGTGGVSVYGVVKTYNASSKVITLYYPALEAPADGATISVVGTEQTGFWTNFMKNLIMMYSGR